MNEGPFGQEEQLNQLMQSQVDCTIITVNGVQIRGTIQAHDKYSVLIRTQNGMQNLIYKSALSTIRSGK